MAIESHGSLQAGTILDGRYAIRRTIAHGATAYVLEAEHVYTQRVVAVKVPAGDATAREAAAERLRNETHALARVRETGVVEILDAGVAAGAPFLVLELLHGRRLSGLLATRGKLGVVETLALAAQAATLCARCHEHGVVHRNVRPESFMVTADPARQVVLFDFGDASFERDTTAPVPSLRGRTFGTPGYRAPESDGAWGAASPALDVYALGATLFECLTAELPTGDGAAEALRARRPDLPAPLADLVLSAVEADPSRRIGMVELAEALVALIDFPLESVSLLRPPPPKRSARPPAQPSAPPAASEADATPITADATAASEQQATAAAPEAAAPSAEAELDGASRRRHPRASYASPARLITARALIDGRIEEVSEAGLQFLCKAEGAHTGESVRFRFALPISGRIAEVSAIVRWTRSATGTTAIGAELISHPPEVREELRRYVELVGAR